MIIDIPGKGFLNFDNVTYIAYKGPGRYARSAVAYLTNDMCITLYSGSKERCCEEIMRIHDAYLNGDQRVRIAAEQEDNHEEG